LRRFHYRHCGSGNKYRRISIISVIGYTATGYQWRRSKSCCLLTARELYYSVHRRKGTGLSHYPSLW
jgi:hypothetical protein